MQYLEIALPILGDMAAMGSVSFPQALQYVGYLISSLRPS